MLLASSPWTRKYCSIPGLDLSFSLSDVLERCSTLQHTHQLHSFLLSRRLLRSAYVAGRLLALYALHDKSSMSHARFLFDRMPHPTIFNWNTIIRGYSASYYPVHALLLYALMRSRCVSPNMHTFPFVVKSCVRLLSLFQVHAHVFRLGFDRDVFVTSSLVKQYSTLGAMELASKVFDESSNRNIVCWTSLITGYCSRGLVTSARSVFDAMSERNDASWSAMITGYVQNECYEEAIELFRWLRSSSPAVLINDSLLISILMACAGMGTFEDGRWIHSYIDDSKCSSNYGLKLGTALVNFYSKCGFVDSAIQVFEKMSHKDVTAWSAMIMGLAVNGHSRTAIKVFLEMLRHKVMPNAITFIGVLTACAHGCLVDEGRAYLDEMQSIYGVYPTLEHYCCVVDMLSRAGHIAEAMDLIRSMPMEPDGAIWGAALNGCVLHGYTELGERVGKHATDLEPSHCGRYVSLANMYATTGKWDGVLNVRQTMMGKRVRTTAGWSIIEVNGVGYYFIANDKFPSMRGEIYKILHDLNLELVSSGHEIILDEFT